MKFVIHSKSEQGWWNNKIGWVYGIKQATQFDKDEIPRYMPISKEKDAEFQVSEYDE